MRICLFFIVYLTVLRSQSLEPHNFGTAGAGTRCRAPDTTALAPNMMFNIGGFLKLSQTVNFFLIYSFNYYKK
jgi:hypothetical protein